MATDTPVQIGLFGGYNDVLGVHVVSAHTRLQADGTTVFVGEHLRWNRGRQAPKDDRAPRAAPVPEEQTSLFGDTTR